MQLVYEFIIMLFLFSILHSFAVTYVHLQLESLLYDGLQAFFIYKNSHILVAFYNVLWYNKYYMKWSAYYVS